MQAKEFYTEVENYMVDEYGYTMEFAAIDRNAPVKTLRDEVRSFMGDDVKISNKVARYILHDLHESAFYDNCEWYALNPNDLMVAVATFVEL